MIDRSKVLQQLVPIFLTLVILAILVVILFVYLFLLNLLPIGEKLILQIRPVDILVGFTIYLKTEIDFAIFMGRIMSTHPGWRNRIALEIGSGLGNAIGTFLIITLWVIFKRINLLLAVMVLLASLVLFELAHGGLEYLTVWESSNSIKKNIYQVLHQLLDFIKGLTDPLLSKIIPDLGAKLQGKEHLSWWPLFVFSFSVPFILGLDDFAGYVPLFNIVNVFGFAIGVIGGHTLLNISLFISPNKTINLVKNEWVSFVGTLAFIFLGFYGLFEVVKIILLK